MGKRYKNSQIDIPYFEFRDTRGYTCISTLLDSNGFIILGTLMRKNQIIITKGCSDLYVIKKYLSDVKEEIFNFIINQGGVCQISNLHPFVHYLVRYDSILDHNTLDRIKKPKKLLREKHERNNREWYYYPAVKSFFEKNRRAQIAIVVCPLALTRKILFEKIMPTLP